MAQDFILIAPELVLTAGALLVLMIAAFAGDTASRIGNFLSVVTLAIAAITLCAVSGRAALLSRAPIKPMLFRALPNCLSMARAQSVS